MNTYAEKLDLIHWIAELQDISVLTQVRSIKENAPVISASEIISIEKGLSDFQQGRVQSHWQVKKRYEKWL
ncbi:MAG: hypothetical protein FWG84_08985 [Bacteroidales bacterium]|nr:hypothetical protein [Bacteroidales bacterium]